MEPTPLRRPLPGAEDRSTLLIVAGVILLVGGSLAALASLFAVAGTMVAFVGVHLHRASLAPLLVAAVPPSLLIVLGVGLVGLRRWARPVGLVVAGAWLVAGLHLAALLVAAMGVPVYGAPHIFGVGFFAVALFGLLAPLALLILLARRDVARTLEARDVARRRFTDGIPLTALALAFATGAAGVWFAANALVGNELPLPSGSPWSPNAAAIGHLLLAAIALVAASGIARAIRSTVWISLLLTVGYAGLWLNRAATTQASEGPFVYLACLMAFSVALHVAALLRIRARAVFV